MTPGCAANLKGTRCRASGRSDALREGGLRSLAGSTSGWRVIRPESDTMPEISPR